MKQITHRELRNHSGDVLRRVQNGETVLITNGGQPAALLTPVPHGTRAKLVSAGVITPAARPLDVGSWRPYRLPDAEPTENALAALKGER